MTPKRPEPRALHVGIKAAPELPEPNRHDYYRHPLQASCAKALLATLAVVGMGFFVIAVVITVVR